MSNTDTRSERLIGLFTRTRIVGRVDEHRRGQRLVHERVLEQNKHPVVELGAHTRREFGDEADAGAHCEGKVVYENNVHVGQPMQITKVTEQIKPSETEYFRGHGQRRAEYEKYDAIQYDDAHRGRLVLGQDFVKKRHVVEAHQRGDHKIP